MISSQRWNVSLEALDEICRRYGVKELSIFGSALRDDFRSDSDIDILADFEPGAPGGLFAFVRLQYELADLFGRDVDLVPKDSLKWIIRDHVLESAKVIYAA